MYLIFILVFLNLSWSSTEEISIEGEGKFISQEGDSQPFIKEQLLFNSFLDVITKYLKRQGLNSDLFWEKYDQRFQVSFASVENDIRKSEENNVVIAKEIRKKRLEKRLQFGLLNRAIKSYTITSMSRAQSAPNARYIKISAQVDSNLVNRIYFSYISPKKNPKGLNLYVLPLFNLVNMSWNELGVASLKDFSSVVSEHWKMQLELKLKNQINEVILFSDESDAELKRIFQSQVRGRGFYEINTSSSGNLSEGLLLFVKTKIKRVSENILLKRCQVEVALNFTMIDMRNGKIIAHQDFSKSRITFSTEEGSKLASSAATSVYRIPLQGFDRLKKEIFSNFISSNLVYLKVANIKSIEDLLNLQNLLKNKGVAFQLNPRIFSLNSKEGVIEFDFNGNKDQVTNFLKDLEKDKMPDGRSFYVEAKDEYKLIVRTNKLDEKGRSGAKENKKLLSL